MKTMLKALCAFVAIFVLAAIVQHVAQPHAAHTVSLLSPSGALALGGAALIGMQDIHNTTKFLLALAPQVQTNSDTAFTGITIDTAGFDAVEFAIALGTLTDVNVTAAVKIQHGAASDLSDAADVAAGDQIGDTSFTFADDLTTKKIGYLPKSNARKRYVRLVVTPTGNDAGALPISAVCVLSRARTQAVT